MAVLKSFELEGNKKSFANWISNLSPKDVPFTSMIGKERIDQTQYSWQTDALAPAAADAILEGEQFELQTRASTEVLTNFTSTLRRAVRITDTAEEVSTYGRNNEMEYQLRKTSQELLRDVEFMNLSTSVGNPGAGDTHSKHAGFKALVAEVNVPDPDTKAVVHKEVGFFSGKNAFTYKDIFDVTTNLFISGSKADKIMFHPKHMSVFSDKLSYNDEEPLVYRMFDGLDDRFNMNICKIKDPTGRLYSLVPNRFMPEKEVYFFNESDWTQAILRSPQRIKIGKKGPSDITMIEMEVGLRHKHPYASGVLSLVEVDKIGQMVVDKLVMTAFVGDDMAAEITVKRGDAAVGRFLVNWESSDKNVFTCNPETSNTQTFGAGDAQTAIIPVNPGFAVLRATGEKMISNSIGIEVKPPILITQVDTHESELGKRIEVTASVTKHGGGHAVDGTIVTWHSNSKNIVFFDTATGLNPTPTATTATGIALCKIGARYPGHYQIWESVGGYEGPRTEIIFNKADLQVKWTKEQDGLTFGIDDAGFDFEIEVKDKTGTPVHAGAEVYWSVSDSSVANIDDVMSKTGADGKTSMKITPKKSGTVTLTADAYGDILTKTLKVGNPIIEASVTPDAVGHKKVVVLRADLTDAAGNPLSNKTVHWSANPSPYVELASVQSTTDAQGIAQVNVTNERTDQHSVKLVARFDNVSSTTTLNLNQGAVLTLNANPNPAKFGQEVELTGKLLSTTGDFLEAYPIIFSSSPDLGTITQTNTTATGDFSTKFTPNKEGTFTLTARDNLFKINKTIDFFVDEQELDLVVSPVREKLTLGVGETTDMKVTVRYNGAGLQGKTIKISLSDDHIASVSSETLVTNASGEATTTIRPASVGVVGITVSIEGNSKSTTRYFTVEHPKVEVSLGSALVVSAGEQVNGLVKVTKADGEPAPQGTKVVLTSNPVMTLHDQSLDSKGEAAFVFRFPTPETDAFLTATLKDNPEATGTATIQVLVTSADVHSRMTRSTITANVDDRVQVDVTVNDKDGQPMEDVDVLLTSNDTSVILVVSTSGKTDPTGKFTTEITGDGEGTTTLTATVFGTEFTSSPLSVVKPTITANTNFDTIKLGGSVELEIVAKQAWGDVPVTNIQTNFFCSDESATLTPDISNTDGAGEVSCIISPTKAGNIQVWAAVADFLTEKKDVTVTTTRKRSK